MTKDPLKDLTLKVLLLNGDQRPEDTRRCIHQEIHEPVEGL